VSITNNMPVFRVTSLQGEGWVKVGQVSTSWFEITTKSSGGVVKKYWNFWFM